MKKVLILFCFLIFKYAGAQDIPNVTLTAESATFYEVVTSLEAQTKYKFFYKKEWVDSLRYNFSFTKRPLDKVLDTIFEGTLLKYHIKEDQIFILYNTRILTNPRIADLLQQKGTEKESEVVIEKGLIFSRDYQVAKTEGSNPEDQVYEIGSRQALVPQGRASIAGYVKEKDTGEPVTGLLVYSEKPVITATTDESGFYSITLPVGKNTLKYQLVGMKPTHRRVVLFSNGQLNIAIEPDIMSLREVVIESSRGANVRNVLMGIGSINVAETKNVPIVLGERDVMKVATTLAGIQTVGEGAAGLNVRGGKSDQNLITLDDAPIYNTSHFLGFFSVFNSEAIEDMQIYKGSIPARYGGRLSSVMDISSRRANRDSISGSGGVSPVTSKLTLELPLFKSKAGLMLGGRTTYSNWILKKIKNTDFNQNRISFSDFILRYDQDINPNNKISLSGYYSVDNFRMSSDTLFSASNFHYENFAASLGFLHQFSSSTSSKTSFLYSAYRYELKNDASPVNAFQQDFDISEATIKTELNYSGSEKHEFSGGIEVKGIQSNPGTKIPVGDESIVMRQEVETEQAIEAAAFISDQYNITPALSLYAGLRYSMFTSLGSQTVYNYLPGAPRNNFTRTDSTIFSKWDKIKKYHGLEPRISARLKLSEFSSLKGGYIRTRQYVHTLTNSASLSPTDIWRLSSTYLEPQIADQFSLGYYHDIESEKIEASLEGYYKKIQNLLDFKVGSSFLLNPNAESAILQGPGKSYGIELSVKKSGRLNGWVNYTFARTFLKLDSEHNEERINEGTYYPANYDMPHTVNLVANYKLTHRLSVSYNFVYRSGRPITYPVGVYDLHGSPSIHYSDRNAYRIPYYMRMDLGINLEAGHKLGKFAYSYWSFSVYNLLGRDNPYSVFVNVEKNEVRGYKLIVFGVPIPTISYNFKF